MSTEMDGIFKWTGASQSFRECLRCRCFSLLCWGWFWSCSRSISSSVPKGLLSTYNSTLIQPIYDRPNCFSYFYRHRQTSKDHTDINVYYRFRGVVIVDTNLGDSCRCDIMSHWTHLELQHRLTFSVLNDLLDATSLFASHQQPTSAFIPSYT